MKRIGLALLLLATAAPALIGCSSVSPSDGDVAESMLVGHTRLDRVTPKEVAEAFMTKLGPDLAACAAGNPAIVAVDRQNLETFWRPGGRFFANVGNTLETMLGEPGVTSLPVEGLAATVEAWALRVLWGSIDAAGFYEPGEHAPMGFYDAETAARTAKALAGAARPGGKDLAEIHAQWVAIDAADPADLSPWLDPVKVSREPNLAEVKTLMGIRGPVKLESTGKEAILAFQKFRQPQMFQPIATFLASPATRKVWMLAFADDDNEDWAQWWLVVLDDENQVWGMSVGYST